MAVKELFVLLIIGISGCVASNKCPRRGDMWPHCDCSLGGLESLYLVCGMRKEVKGKTIQDYMKVFQRNNISDRRDIKLHFYGLDKNSSIPSRIFEGYDITHLEFYGNGTQQLKNWTEEEGGPAFVGLEDTLEEIQFFDIINAPRKYDNYEQEKAPMSLGYLRKLRRVEFTLNDFDTFANGWFDKGPSSLEEVKLTLCKTRYFGNRAFAGLSNLKDIQMFANEIESVSRNMFPNPANHLWRINLSYNKLKDLPAGMFTNMPSLTDVDISDNHLTRLPENVWRPIWSGIVHLSLSLNRLNCDDHINWMFNVKPPEHLWALCHEPKDMHAVELEKFIREKQGKY